MTLVAVYTVLCQTAVLRGMVWVLCCGKGMNMAVIKRLGITIQCVQNQEGFGTLCKVCLLKE